METELLSTVLPGNNCLVPLLSEEAFSKIIVSTSFLEYSLALNDLPVLGYYSKKHVRKLRILVLKKRSKLKGPSQSVCIAAVCHCYYPGNLISFTVQMSRFVRISVEGTFYM